jgi:hypothetical protein
MEIKKKKYLNHFIIKKEIIKIKESFKKMYKMLDVKCFFNKI